MKMLASLVLLCSLPLGVTAKTPTRPTPPKAPIVKQDTIKHPTPPTKAPEEKRPEVVGTDMPVENWVGHTFVGLRMAAMFQKFGYELYSSPLLAKETAPINPDVENAKHRILYSRLVGKSLTVTTVTKPDSEYLVSFVDDQHGTPVFGRTHKGAIQGIALGDDIELAKKRWLGKQIYARKRHIGTFDSLKSLVGSIKVPIQTPLTVTDIVWGLTPMPTQPLWLLVESADGKRGFVGTYFSWTNVMTDMRKQGRRPWDNDVLEANPQMTYQWGDDVWEQVNIHNVVAGMTQPQVLLAWDDPLKEDTVAVGPAKQLRWTYQGQCLYFSKDTLVRIENR